MMDLYRRKPGFQSASTVVTVSTPTNCIEIKKQKINMIEEDIEKRFKGKKRYNMTFPRLLPPLSNVD